MNTRNVPLAPARPGCYTARQIIGQTDRLLTLLSTGAEQYTYTVEYMATWRPGTGDGAAWSVSCTSKSGTDERYFTWNAYSGQLEAISCRDQLDPNPIRVLSPREAVEYAMEWAKCLGLVQSQEICQLAKPPWKLQYGWSVEIKAGQKRMMVNINDRTGRVSSVFVRE